MLDAHAHVMQVKLCKANTRGVTKVGSRSTLALMLGLFCLAQLCLDRSGLR